GGQTGVQLDHGARPGLEEGGEAAIGIDAGEGGVGTVHVVAGPAGAAETARNERVDDDRIADGHVVHRRAHLVNPAGVLVAQDIWQPDARLLLPLALNDVQVGAAQTGAANAHDHVVGTGDLGVRYLFEDRVFVISV